MASLALAPPLDFENKNESEGDASPSRDDRKQRRVQQNGDDDGVAEEEDNDLEQEVHPLSQSSPLILEDNNNQQEDDPKSTTAESSGPRLQRPSSVESRAAAPTTRPQDDQSDECDEIDRLKKTNQDLAQQLWDLKVQYGRHVHSMRAEQQQRNAAHERSEREWKLQTELLQRSHNETVDNWRRAQAQVEMLQERLAQLETPVDEVEAASSPRRQQAASPLRLTQQQSSLVAPNQHPHRRTVSRSVVGTSRANAPHVTCHQLTARSDAITVRATRLGRNRSAPADSTVAVENRGYPQALDATRLQPPPVVPFQLRDSHSERSNNQTQLASPASSPARSYTERAHQEPSGCTTPQQSPPPPRPVRLAQSLWSEISTTAQTSELPHLVLPSSYPTQDDVVITIESEPALRDEASSGRSMSTRQVAPELAAVAETTDGTTSAASALDAPSAWSLFSSFPNMQNSLDVEHGFSPPRQHAVPHEQHRQKEHQPQQQQQAQAPSSLPSSPNQHQEHNGLDTSAFPMF